LLASTYTFCNASLKSHDYYFTGFPAIWNVVVLYFFVLQTNTILNLLAIFAFAILTFIPWHYVHPLRVEKFRAITIAATIAWSVAVVALMFELSPKNLFSALLLGSTVYFVAICAVRTIKGEPISSAH